MPASTLEVGRRLVELLCRMENMKAIDELYAPDVVSTEVHGDAHMPARMDGIDAIRRKNQWWLDNHEIHGWQANGPWPHHDRFIVTMAIDVTPKVGPFANKRMQFEEAALYTVQEGKIVQEEFFYHMG